MTYFDVDERENTLAALQSIRNLIVREIKRYQDRETDGDTHRDGVIQGKLDMARLIHKRIQERIVSRSKTLAKRKAEKCNSHSHTRRPSTPTGAESATAQ